MMVSRGMLWARKSCQVLYCSKVSQSKDWTEGGEEQGSEVTGSPSECFSQSACVYLTEDVEHRVLPEHHQVPHHHMTHQLLQLHTHAKSDYHSIAFAVRCESEPLLSELSR